MLVFLREQNLASLTKVEKLASQFVLIDFRPCVMDIKKQQKQSISDMLCRAEVFLFTFGRLLIRAGVIFRM